jgi:hypothetical protein
LYVLRFCTCVYPYAMKYLIIFSFGQNVSRMNTGDLTKLWRLKIEYLILGLANVWIATLCSQ